MLRHEKIKQIITKHSRVDKVRLMCMLNHIKR